MDALCRKVEPDERVAPFVVDRALADDAAASKSNLGAIPPPNGQPLSGQSFTPQPILRNESIDSLFSYWLATVQINLSYRIKWACPSFNRDRMLREGWLTAPCAPSISTSVAERLRAGDPVPSEVWLAAGLGVSRTVVREAFRALAALGIIDLGNGRRARVGTIDKDVLGLVIDHAVHTDQASIQQIYDVRRTIEMRTVALAALRRSEPEAQAISGRAAAMRQAFSHPDEAMEHDIAFHCAIAVASRNPLFALIVGSFSVVTRQTWRIGWDSRSTDAERLANVECHARIAAAIEARKPRAAEGAMAEHFDGSVKALLSAGVI